MKKVRKAGNFWLCLLVNMLLNLEWTIPAWAFLAMHFLLGWPIWLFWVALGLWLLNILLWMDILGWASRCSNTPDKPKENKNPYSAKRTPAIDTKE